MPWNRRKCKDCKKSNVMLSRRGFCIDCSKKSVLDLAKQLKAKRGKHYQSWKKGVLKYINEK